MVVGSLEIMPNTSNDVIDMAPNNMVDMGNEREEKQTTLLFFLGGVGAYLCFVMSTVS